MLVERFESEQDQIKEQVSKAVRAIQKYAEKKAEEAAASSGAQQLLPDPETVTIQFSLNRIPVKKDFRFNEIAVPHPVIDVSSKSLCLLVRDPKEKAVAQVAAQNLPFEKVIAVKSLKRKYASIEARKELANRFDLFFCEAQIFEMMGHLLGSYFFVNKKAKIPSPMKYLSAACFEKTVRCARFRVRGGNVVTVRIGHRNMDCDHLVENAMAVVKHMAGQYCTNARTLNDIYSMTIGATNVIDLPVWSVPVGEETVEVEEEKAVSVETPKVSKKKQIEPKKEEAVEAPKDLAAVPVKKLKQVQQQRLDEAKQQLVVNKSEEGNKKRRKTK